jgi:hypothetical protein
MWRETVFDKGHLNLEWGSRPLRSRSTLCIPDATNNRFVCMAAFLLLQRTLEARGMAGGSAVTKKAALKGGL